MSGSDRTWRGGAERSTGLVASVSVRDLTVSYPSGTQALA